MKGKELKAPKYEPKRFGHITWNQAMVIILCAFLFAMALKTFSEAPTIEGYSVKGEPVYENSFESTTALLGVIFLFFSLFILIISRRLDYRKGH